MADYGDYGQYVVTDVYPGAPLPALPKDVAVNMTYLDSNVIPGAFNVICAWFMPRTEPMVIIDAPHTHEQHEVVCFYGSDLDNPFELNAHIELYMEGQKMTLTKSGLIYIPAGMSHSPLTLVSIDKPIFHFSSVTTGEWVCGDVK